MSETSALDWAGFGNPERYPKFACGVRGREILIMVKIDETALAALCERLDVESLRLFGSAARGEERPGSDLDLLVRFSETKSLIEIVRIEREFEEHFGRPVDLVTEGELSPYIRDEVLSQASPVYGPRG